jgi:alpha-N-arabinofuranosidase
VPYLATSVVYNEAAGEMIVYAMNRSLEEDMELEIDPEGFVDPCLIEHVELYTDDLKAINDRDHQRVAPVQVEIRDSLRVNLKKHSWNMLRYRVEATK